MGVLIREYIGITLRNTHLGFLEKEVSTWSLGGDAGGSGFRDVGGTIVRGAGGGVATAAVEAGGMSILD